MKNALREALDAKGKVIHTLREMKNALREAFDAMGKVINTLREMKNTLREVEKYDFNAGNAK